MNSASLVLLLLGFGFVKTGRIGAHKACMIGATFMSACFLTSYLIYHAQAGSVKFTGQGAIRPVYFAILITHVFLAALVVPMAGRLLYFAWRGEFDKHKATARWAWPIWVYVSFTGITVYAMLYRVSW